MTGVRSIRRLLCAPGSLAGLGLAACTVVPAVPMTAFDAEHVEVGEAGRVAADLCYETYRRSARFYGESWVDGQRVILFGCVS